MYGLERRLPIACILLLLLWVWYILIIIVISIFLTFLALILVPFSSASGSGLISVHMATISCFSEQGSKGFAGVHMHYQRLGWPHLPHCVLEAEQQPEIVWVSM